MADLKPPVSDEDKPEEEDEEDPLEAGQPDMSDVHTPTAEKSKKKKSKLPFTEFRNRLFAVLTEGGVEADRLQESWDKALVAYDYYYDDYDWSPPKLEKSDDRVNYKAASVVGTECEDCKFWCWGTCRLVEGSIDEHATCDLFVSSDDSILSNSESRELARVASNNGHAYRLFNKLQKYMSPPEFVPILPAPGTWQHPSYGEITITQERNQSFMDNFAQKVYQDRLPLDAEHETKISGACGWIVGLRMNLDGSVDGKIEWTDRGVTMMEGDRFAYISPEWYEVWTDPATEVQYSDVLVGAALTTRPFFKELKIEALIASEGSIRLYTDSNDLPKGATEMAGKDPIDNTEQFAEQVQTLTTQLAEAQAERATLVAAREQDAANLRLMSERIDSLETSATRERLSAISKEFSGDPEKNLNLITAMAKALGEDSEAFKDYVEQQKAIAAQLKTSDVFTEIGTSRRNSENGTANAVAQFNAKAAELRKDNPTLSYGDAVLRVAKSDPALYDQYRKESYSDGK